METNLKNLKENIKKRFADAGLETEDFTNIKNGICKKGLRIKTGTNIDPIIYFDTFVGLLESGKSIPEVVEIILSQIKIEKLTEIDFGKLLKVLIPLPKLIKEQYLHLISRKKYYGI